MKLTENVYLVGGGPFSGFGLTPDADAHTYLVDGGSELALIDCGLGLDGGFAALESNIRGAGYDPADISRAFVTHHHGDHAGGAKRVADSFGAAIAMSADAVAVMEAGDEEAASLNGAKAIGYFPEEARLLPTPIDDQLRDGDQLAVGDATITFVATPGHCAGHGSYLLTGVDTPALFGGDAVFWAGRILLQAIPDCDLAQSNESVQRLAELEYDAFLPGHGSIAVSGGAMHPQMAAAEIGNLAVPKNVI